MNKHMYGSMKFIKYVKLRKATLGRLPIKVILLCNVSNNLWDGRILSAQPLVKWLYKIIYEMVADLVRDHSWTVR